MTKRGKLLIDAKPYQFLIHAVDGVGVGAGPSAGTPQIEVGLYPALTPGFAWLAVEYP